MPGLFSLGKKKKKKSKTIAPAAPPPQAAPPPMQTPDYARDVPDPNPNWAAERPPGYLWFFSGARGKVPTKGRVRDMIEEHDWERQQRGGWGMMTGGWKKGADGGEGEDDGFEGGGGVGMGGMGRGGH